MLTLDCSERPQHGQQLCVLQASDTFSSVSPFGVLLVSQLTARRVGAHSAILAGNPPWFLLGRAPG